MTSLDVQAEKFFGIAPSTAKKLMAKLTHRQKAILRLYATGNTLEGIHNKLKIAIGTVLDHLEKIAVRTGVKRRQFPAMYFAAHFQGDLMLVTYNEIDGLTVET